MGGLENISNKSGGTKSSQRVVREEMNVLIGLFAMVGLVHKALLSGILKCVCVVSINHSCLQVM